MRRRLRLTIRARGTFEPSDEAKALLDHGTVREAFAAAGLDLVDLWVSDYEVKEA